VPDTRCVVATSPVIATVERTWRRSDKLAIAGMIGFVLFLNVVGWGVLALVVVPQNLTLGSTGAFGLGVGVTAFLLGVRHAFDADHIAAIDNTTRKLVGEGKPGLGVGFWFSLGHSSVVFGLSVLLAIGVSALAGPVQDEDSQLQQTLGLLGTVVAGTFLIAIGLMNLVSVIGIAKVFRALRSGEFDEAELERQLHSRGFLARPAAARPAAPGCRRRWRAASPTPRTAARPANTALARARAATVCPPRRRAGRAAARPPRTGPSPAVPRPLAAPAADPSGRA
jgi:high-affinity nickel permease